jgi:hypothetical protein
MYFKASRRIIYIIYRKKSSILTLCNVELAKMHNHLSKILVFFLGGYFHTCNFVVCGSKEFLTLNACGFTIHKDEFDVF